MEHPEIARGWQITVVVLVFVSCCLIGAIWSLRQAVNGVNDGIVVIQTGQKASKQRGYELRALSCTVLSAVGVPPRLDGPCFDPEVIPYYDGNVPKAAR